MKKSTYLNWFFLTTLFALSAAFAKEEFKWEPVTDQDWNVVEDTTHSPRGAVMVFEKIIANDRNLLSEKCIRTIYRRIRILNSEGRKWADVITPYLHKKQKIIKILGRTVLRDGTEISLAPAQIFEKQVLQTKGIKILQKSFSLPAVTDDCIIEYFFEIQLPIPFGIWDIQKELDLMQGKLTWIFYRGGGLSSYEYSITGEMLTPNYVLKNINRQIGLEYLPSIKAPEEVQFTIDHVERFDNEPFTLPEIALKANLHCYYGSSDNPASFWGYLSNVLAEGLGAFTESNKNLRKVIESLPEGSKEEKMRAAYTWLQTQIENTELTEKEEKIKNAKNVDEVIKRRYGTSSEINFAFYDMLREMNIDAKLLFTIDRDENHFDDQVKAFQFDRTLVGVVNAQGKYNYYNPGDKYLPFQKIGWFNEGTNALMVGDLSHQFVTLECSNPVQNQIYRFHDLRLNENFDLMGILTEKNSGHPAHGIRLDIASASEKEKQDFFNSYWKSSFPDAEADSIPVTGLEDLSSNIIVRARRSIVSVGQQVGDRLLLKPITLLEKQDNPFVSDLRKYLIVFDYAKDLTEVVHLKLPEGWKVETLPESFKFSNPVGLIEIDFKILGEGTEFTAQYHFRLNWPLWRAENYQEVKRLFQMRQTIEDRIVTLKKES